MRLFNLQIKDELHAEITAAAARSDRSASGYVRDAIREKLAREAEPATPATVTDIRTKEVTA
jgi:plasmid stability protein